MTANTAPLTDAQRETFHARVRHWQRELSLLDWRIGFDARKSRSAADVELHQLGRVATYRLGADFGPGQVADAEIDALALHECLHILLVEVVDQVDWGITGDVLKSAEHRVINTLVSALTRAAPLVIAAPQGRKKNG